MTKIVKSIRSLPYAKRLEALGLTTLETRRTRGDLIQFYKIFNNINRINLLNPINLHPPGSTRCHGLRVKHDKPTKYKNRDFFLTNRITPLWNLLPSQVVNATNVNTFKNRLDLYLVKNQLK